MPITLNNINEKVRTVEGSTRTTPITMSNLDSRINTLETTQQKWKIYNFTWAQNRTITIPSDVIGWNWCFIEGKLYDQVNGSEIVRVSDRGKTFNQGSSPKKQVVMTSNGSTITSNYAAYGETATILFYK